MAGRWPGGILQARGYGTTVGSTLRSAMHSAYSRQQNRQAIWPKRDVTSAFGVTTQSSANAASYTFNNINIGLPATNKYLYTIIATGINSSVSNSSGVTNVTVGGSSFTQLTSVINLTTDYMHVSVWAAKIESTSTSTSIVLTMGGTAPGPVLGSFPVNNVLTPFVAQHTTSVNIGGSSTSVSMTLNVPAGAIGFAFQVKQKNPTHGFTAGVAGTTFTSTNGDISAIFAVTSPSTLTRTGHTVTTTASSTTGCMLGISIC